MASYLQVSEQNPNIKLQHIYFCCKGTSEMNFESFWIQMFWVSLIVSFPYDKLFLNCPIFFHKFNFKCKKF